MSRSHRGITLGAVLGLLPSIGLAWAFATTAADSRMKPHIAAAAVRVRMMCQLAEYQIQSTEKVCAAVGAMCPRPPELKTEVLGEQCRENE